MVMNDYHLIVYLNDYKNVLMMVLMMLNDDKYGDDDDVNVFVYHFVLLNKII
jgi:hypothetical protein